MRIFELIADLHGVEYRRPLALLRTDPDSDAAEVLEDYRGVLADVQSTEDVEALLRAPLLGQQADGSAPLPPPPAAPPLSPGERGIFSLNLWGTPGKLVVGPGSAVRLDDALLPRTLAERLLSLIDGGEAQIQEQQIDLTKAERSTSSPAVTTTAPADRDSEVVELLCLAALRKKKSPGWLAVALRHLPEAARVVGWREADRRIAVALSGLARPGAGRYSRITAVYPVGSAEDASALARGLRSALESLPPTSGTVSPRAVVVFHRDLPTAVAVAESSPSANPFSVIGLADS